MIDARDKNRSQEFLDAMRKVYDLSKELRKSEDPLVKEAGQQLWVMVEAAHRENTFQALSTCMVTFMKQLHDYEFKRKSFLN